MKISEVIRNKIQKLLDQSRLLRMNAQFFDGISAKREAWLASTLHVAQVLVPDTLSPYRTQISQAMLNGMWEADNRIDIVSAILEQLVNDIDEGMLDSLEAKARANATVEFSAQASYYLKGGKVEVAGVLAGVTFEDTIRRICTLNKIVERDVSLDRLITELVKVEVLTEVVGSRARAAAAVRTKATHAQWDGFTKTDVSSALTLTQELLQEHFGSTKNGRI